MQQTFFVAFQRSVRRHNPVSELCRQFLWPHGLGFALICILSCETLYRLIQSVEFTTSGVQSRWRNMSKMIKINRSVIEKGLNTFVNVIFQFSF